MTASFRCWCLDAQHCRFVPRSSPGLARRIFFRPPARACRCCCWVVGGWWSVDGCPSCLDAHRVGTRTKRVSAKSWVGVETGPAKGGWIQGSRGEVFNGFFLRPGASEKGPPKNSKTPRNREERREDPPGPPDPCTAFSVYQQHPEPSSEEQQQAQRSSRTTRSCLAQLRHNGGESRVPRL